MSSPSNEGIVVGFGDPLLDISVNVYDNEILQKYNLKPDDAVLANEHQQKLPQELASSYSPKYTAGGSAQNTLRVIQWILRQPRLTMMVGAIGYDQFGRYLEQNARECGVDIRYHYVADQPTGTCSVLLSNHGMCRSLVTTKGASAHYSVNHLRTVWESIEKARFFYVTTYFLSGNLETVLEVAQHAYKKGKVLSLNLSAPFLMSLHKDKLDAILPYVGIIFGNDTELEAFWEARNETKSKKEAAKSLSTLLAASPRLVVITSGNEPVIVAKGNNVTEYPIEKIDPDRVIDTNGAGDAFVGGFLASLVKACPIDVAVRNGCVAAMAIIQEVGCTTPDRSKVRFFSDWSIAEPRIPAITQRQISI